MKDRAAVGANLYIEDNPENITALRAQNHPTIVFVNSTNWHLPAPRVDTWDEAVPIVLEAMQDWKARKGDEAALAGT